ncbi:metallophosphoesterase family protein [Desulfothermobacter acidiphilus]|uniref:metallophosphoesterase family protein n=1 Tax=Desulfothermobacter acidiphilus TaxID=1938353 RepID=UPI003F8CBB6B
MLHLADLHLGYQPPLPSPLRQELARERDELLRRAVDMALGREVHLVLIAGDLFDHHAPPPRLVEEVIAQLRRLVDSGVHVVTVPGNHDEITYYNSVYRKQGERWPGLLVRNPQPELLTTLEVKGQLCHLVSMAYVEGITTKGKSILERLPPAPPEGITVAVFHASLDWESGDRSPVLATAALRQAGYHYVALGHIHQGGKFCWGGKMANYAGMVAGKNFADPGVGFFTLVQLDGEQARLELQPVKVASWKVVELDLTACRDLAELERTLSELSAEEELLRIRLTGTASFPLSEESLRDLEARCGQRCRYLELVDATQVWQSEWLTEWAAEPTVRGLFVRRLQARLEQARDEDEAELVRLALKQGLLALKEGVDICRR